MLFIDWYLPGFKAGGPIRSVANMVTALRDEYEFLVVTRNTDYTSAEPYAGIISDAWNDGPNGEKIYYFSESQLNRKNLRRLIADTDFDMVYINGIYSWNFSILPLILCRKYGAKKRIIVATRGMLAESAIEVKSGKKKLFLNLARFAGIYKNVVFHATNEIEANDIQKAIHASAKILVADNFPVKRIIPVSRLSKKKKDSLRMVCIARVAPEKNIDFGISVMADAWATPMSMDVFGPIYDLNYSEKCMDMARHLPAGIEVDFRGPVEPKHIPSLLMEYDLLFFPTRGENFGHVIIESLMSGTPVLTSDQTPFKDAGGVESVALNPVLMKEALLRWYRMGNEEHQHHINAALAEARKKNDTSPLVERYRLLFGK